MADQNSQTNSEVDWFLQTKKKEVSPTVSPPEADTYKRQNKRGTAIIFNHKHFDTKEYSTRLGTDKDRDDVIQLLDDLKFDVFSHNDLTSKQIMEVLDAVLTPNSTRLGTDKDRDDITQLDDLKFDVFSHNDLTSKQIMEVLDAVSKMDHSDSDCLMVVVMSHGSDGIIYARDCCYQTKKLWKFFTPIHCPTLAGKPKLFFIQACRGENTDPGFEVRYDETDSGCQDRVYSIPVMADILVMYATVEGYFAWRDSKNGSFFIQALVNQLKKLHKTKDLLTILTCVNREVAIGFTSLETQYPELNGKKEMCSIVSMLTRLFYLN